MIPYEPWFLDGLRKLSEDMPTYGIVFDDLYRMLAAESEPALSLDDIHALLRAHRIADRHGVAPIDINWEPTYDLNAAAAEGWRRKAALVADRFAFSADGATYNRDQLYKHCMEQSRRYSARAVRTLDTSPYADEPQYYGGLA